MSWMLDTELPDLVFAILGLDVWFGHFFIALEKHCEMDI